MSDELALSTALHRSPPPNTLLVRCIPNLTLMPTKFDYAQLLVPLST